MATILVVDDDEQVLDLLVEILMDAGFAVVPAHNGQEALDQFAPQSIDAVITDMRMPRLDGLGLLVAVKARAPQTPVIMITGYSGLDNERLTLAHHGVDLILRKPLGQVSDLVNAVTAILAAPKTASLDHLMVELDHRSA